MFRIFTENVIQYTSGLFTLSILKDAILHRTGNLFLRMLEIRMNASADLADFVRQTMLEKDLSTYDVAKRSKQRITAATVTKILNRDIKSSGVETLAGLADGLGVPADTIFRLVRGYPAEAPTKAFDIYAERFDAQDLSKSEWQYLENFFKEHVDHYRRQRRLLNEGAFVKPEAEQPEKKKK